MDNFVVFLKVLQRSGYPNPNLESIASTVGYDLDSFLSDMYDYQGQEKTDQFIDKALTKLLGPDKTIIVDVTEQNYDTSWVKFKLDWLEYDNDDAVDGVRCYMNIIDSRITVADGEVTTYDEMASEVDMGEWGDWNEYTESLAQELMRQVFLNCGFWIYTA